MNQYVYKMIIKPNYYIEIERNMTLILRGFLLYT